MKINYVEGASSGQSDNPQAVFLNLLLEDAAELETFAIHTVDVPPIAAALLFNAQANAERLAGDPAFETLMEQNRVRNFELLQETPIQAIDLEVLPDGRFRLNLGFCSLFFTAGKLLAHSLEHLKRGNMN